jgi:hypothetical protein
MFGHTLIDASGRPRKGRSLRASAHGYKAKSGHRPSTSAHPPAADIQLVTSGIRGGADAPDKAPLGPLVTLSGHAMV